MGFAGPVGSRVTMPSPELVATATFGIQHSVGSTRTAAVFAAELFEFASQRLPIITVSGLFCPHFGIECRTEIVDGRLSRESNQWPVCRQCGGLLRKHTAEFDE